MPRTDPEEQPVHYCGYTWNDSDWQANCCYRPVWGSRDRCIWHADVGEGTEKPIEELQRVRERNHRSRQRREEQRQNRRQKSRCIELLDGAQLSGAELSDELLFSYCSLRDTDFSNSNLQRVDFSNANLDDANLSNANLRDADLSKTKMRNVNLSTAKMSGTNLSNAMMNGAILSEADLRGIRTSPRPVDLSEGDLCNANLFEADLRDANLFEVDLRDADLSEANLRDTDLSNSLLMRADLPESNLNGANLSRADLHEAELLETNLRDVDFSGADLRDADFRKTDLRDVDFLNADLRSTDFSKADLRGADFLDADLRGADFSKLGASHASSPEDWNEIARTAHDLASACSERGLIKQARQLTMWERQARRKEASESGEHWEAIKSWISWQVTGYGISVRRVIRNMVLLFGLATIAYSLLTRGEDVVTILYYSVVTFTTTPPRNPSSIDSILFTDIFHGITMLEAFFGTLLLVLFGYVLGNRESV